MDKKSVTHLVPQLITALETYSVRHAVLRKGRAIETCAFEGDELKTTFHLGGFLKNRLVAVASFYEADQQQHGLIGAVQLRGMAVLEDYHGMGYGKEVLQFGERFVKEKGYQTLWMNARISALGFYTKLEYQQLGTIFEIPLIGAHVVLYKKL